MNEKERNQSHDVNELFKMDLVQNRTWTSTDHKNGLKDMDRNDFNLFVLD